MTLFILLSFVGHVNKAKERIISIEPPPQGHNNFSMQVNEELLYEVSYAFVKLGTVRIKTLNHYDKNGKQVYKAIAFMDSYKIPLISLHSIFESEMDETIYAHQFIASELDEGEWRYTKYDFNYNRDKVFCERGYPSNKRSPIKDTVSLDKKLMQDGLSLFFKARQTLYSQKPENIPVFINEKKENTNIEYPCKRETIEIEAVKYPIDVLYFKGKATFVGVFGLTGDFQGWFSNDAARIPIFARMTVILGSVKVELKSWTRTNWAPPKKIN